MGQIEKMRRALKAFWLRRRRMLAWTLGMLVLAVAGVAFVLPLWLRGFAEARLSAQLQRPVHIERVRLNPLALSAAVEGLQIGGRGAEPALLRCDRVYARLGLGSLWHIAPVVSALRIEHPQVFVARVAANRYSVSDLIDRFANAPASPGTPTRFALYNLELVEGYIVFDDQPVARRQRVEHLDVAIPFVSNIPAEVDVFVEPHVSAMLDGTRFELRGKARVFADTPQAALDLNLAPVDVVQFLPYLPLKTKLTLTEGRLGADLKLAFRQPRGKAPTLNLSGQVQALDWRFVDGDGAPLGQFKRFAVDLASLDPTARTAHLRSVEWDDPRATVTRDATQRINWVEALRFVEAPPLPPPAKASSPVVVEKSLPWTWQLDHFSLRQGALTLSDQTPTPAFTAVASPIALGLHGLSSDFAKPVSYQFALSGDQGESLSLEGKIIPASLAGEGVLAFSGLRPLRAAGYLAPVLNTLAIDDGVVQGRVPFRITGPQAVSVTGAELALAYPVLRLATAKQAFFKASRLAVSGFDLDTASRQIGVAQISLEAPDLAISRGPKGQFDLAALLPPPAADATVPLPTAAASKPPSPNASAPAAAATPAPPWRYLVGHLKLTGGGLRYEDTSQEVPLRLSLSALALELGGLGNAPNQNATVQLATRWGSKGQLSLKGGFSLAPLRTNLNVDGRALDVVPLVAQAVEHYKVSVTRARLSAKGALGIDLAGTAPKLSWRGDVAVADFASIDLINDADFVRWRQFAFNKADVSSEPLAVTVGDVVLADFQTRLILDKSGNLNLREVTRERDAVEAPPPAAASTPVALAAGATSKKAALPPLRIDRITLSGGTVQYSDRFVKPNFDANLTKVGGTVSNLATDPSRVANLVLHGEVDDDAPLSVSGQLAPFRNDRYLDIKASVKGYELTNLSSYSGKYVGYDIEKGKLSLDLRYTITDRKLSADNHLVLDQLTFGDKVESPDATSLPVRFAVALLKNSRGEIDINLPVGGTLDDPEFSVGGLVWRMIGNFFARIVTSPFAFFAGASEHGELSYLSFAPGSDDLSPEAVRKLGVIAKTLVDRGGLKLEIAGCADATDIDGLKQDIIQRKVRTLKLREMARKGESGGSIAELRIDPAEYPVLLTKVYKEEKFAKPRNALGFAKDLSVPEMEKLIVANASVGDSEVRALALARATAVKTWLEDEGGVPAEQLFLLAPKLDAEAVKAGTNAQRVDFSLR